MIGSGNEYCHQLDLFLFPLEFHDSVTMHQPTRSPYLVDNELWVGSIGKVLTEPTLFASGIRLVVAIKSSMVGGL